MTFKNKSLPTYVIDIIESKGTEPPNTGEYNEWDKPGTYLCRRCGLALFRSDTKFIAACGWPSFDEELPNTVKRNPDADGRRTEILCNRCDAHLGHVFQGESYTQNNTRHCVNSLSLDFTKDLKVEDTEEAIFAAGCFWQVEKNFKAVPGVVQTEVGYTGGQTESPTYKEVCTGNTGHFEAVRVIYDPTRITYENLLKAFFNLHDSTQSNGQGPDIGQQYQSAIFYYNDQQKQTAETQIESLKQNGINPATKLNPVNTFWKAEPEHQNYCDRSPQF